MKLVLITLLVLLSGRSVWAQPSPFNMFTDCPQGCRTVDFLASCGSITEVAYCNMAVNGDVELRCNNGNSYALGQFGCSSNVTGSDALDYFFDKTRHCVSFVSREFYNVRQYLAPVIAVIAVWITVAGYRYIAPTLTIFAFVWEFFFALYLLMMAGSTDDVATYIALALAAFVALLCMWRGPMFGRAVVGVSLGTLLSVFALTIADAPLTYVSVGVVIALDVVGIAFAYIKKRSSIIALFGFSVATMIFLCIATWGNYTISKSGMDATAIVALTIPSFVAGVLCVLVNAYWCRLRERQKRVNQRFNPQRQHEHMLADVTTTRPGNRSPASSRASPANRSTPTNRGYGAVYEDFGP